MKHLKPTRVYKGPVTLIVRRQREFWGIKWFSGVTEGISRREQSIKGGGGDYRKLTTNELPVKKGGVVKPIMDEENSIVTQPKSLTPLPIQVR